MIKKRVLKTFIFALVGIVISDAIKAILPSTPLSNVLPPIFFSTKYCVDLTFGTYNNTITGPGRFLVEFQSGDENDYVDVSSNHSQFPKLLDQENLVRGGDRKRFSMLWNTEPLRLFYHEGDPTVTTDNSKKKTVIVTSLGLLFAWPQLSQSTCIPLNRFNNS